MAIGDIAPICLTCLINENYKTVLNQTIYCIELQGNDSVNAKPKESQKIILIEKQEDCQKFLLQFKFKISQQQMRQDTNYLDNKKNTDKLTSPIPTKKGLKREASPFLRDFSPFPFDLHRQLRIEATPQIARLEIVNTPMVNYQQNYLGQIDHNNEIGLISSVINFQKQCSEQEEENQYQSEQSPSEMQSASQSKSKQPSPQKPTTTAQNNLVEEIISKIKQNKESKQRASQSPEIQKKIFCNCKRSKCLKFYCDCFRMNEPCKGCNCVDCHNNQDHQQQRNDVIYELRKKNIDGFKSRIDGDQHTKGCNCKKSNCLKKYCQCFQAGLKCGEYCKCQDCKNCQQKQFMTPKSQKQPIMMTVKKTRRYFQDSSCKV